MTTEAPVTASVVDDATSAFDDLPDDGATRVAPPSFDFAKLAQEVVQRGAPPTPRLDGLSPDGAKSLSAVTLTIEAQVGKDDKMFGSVTAGTIADELKHQFDVSLDKRKINLDHPIRTLGDHEVELRLHADVNVKLKVNVESANPPSVSPLARGMVRSRVAPHF